MVTKNITAGELSGRKKLEKLIEQQGTKPLSIEELRAMGDVWPVNESVDEFLAWREKMRLASRRRKLH
jgi:hypothetical protein